MSEIPEQEIITKAELKILMKHEYFGLKQFQDGKFTLQVLGVFRRNKAENKKKHTHPYPSLLEVATKRIATVKGQPERWISFDVTSFVDIMRNRGRKHVKFVLRAKPIGGTDIDPKLIGLDNHVKFDTEKGLLAIFSGDDISLIHKKRRKRDVSNKSNSYEPKEDRRRRR